MKKDIKENREVKGQDSLYLSDSDFEFMKERLEKVSLVIYYISKEWSDQEPLKKSIRQVAIDCALIAQRKEPFSPEALQKLAHGFTIQKDKLEPLLSLAVSAGFLSSSARDAFKEELVALEARFSVSFARALLPAPTPRVAEPPRAPRAKEGSFSGASHVSPDRGKGSAPLRQDQILSALSNGVEYSIRDIVGAVPGVSEKTIQRELSRLVATGVLVKKGERRWSTYRRP